ncbi:iron ABC transporter substrate-binding protein [Amycolatopsis antarctica]|uniref:Iron ABC transporter substrate-binding protein n=2 Tax=Amycolatopsis antarctica TaxID=1854586 RepID=A0A263D0V9_9PSEU|nr:iron ABC transporter substrate-binding protein [Amycolatopsis antarctica]
MRRRITAFAAVALSVVTLAACGQVEEESAPAGATIDTMFGSVTAPEQPKRVIALGWSDAEAALALGVQPIAASDWLAFGGEGVGPWAAGRYTTPPQILGTTELSYEQISGLNPDLILNTRSDASKEKNDELSKIAPTIGPPEGVVSYGTTWRQQMEMVSSALGKPDEGARLIGEVDAKIAGTKAANPQFAGKTVGVGAYYADKYGGYVRGDSRVDLMESLGFVNKPEIQALSNGNFYADLSREQIELLSADLTVVFPIGGDPAALRSDQVLNQIPSAKAGNLLLLEDETLLSAFSSASTLGTLWAIDNATPLFAKTLAPAA